MEDYYVRGGDRWNEWRFERMKADFFSVFQRTRTFVTNEYAKVFATVNLLEDMRKFSNKNIFNSNNF